MTRADSDAEDLDLQAESWSWTQAQDSDPDTEDSDLVNEDSTLVLDSVAQDSIFVLNLEGVLGLDFNTIVAT